MEIASQYRAPSSNIFFETPPASGFPRQSIHNHVSNVNGFDELENAIYSRDYALMFCILMVQDHCTIPLIHLTTGKG
jgi:hypothetical protein